jgi:hypothetical protein
MFIFFRNFKSFCTQTKKIILKFTLVKQEKDEKKPIPTPKASSYQRRLKPSQVTGEHIFENEGELLFIQVH